MQLAYNQLDKRYLDLQTENGYITAELLRAREQLAEFANAENTAATRLAELQKQHEIEAALRDATQYPGENMDRMKINYAPRCSGVGSIKTISFSIFLYCVFEKEKLVDSIECTCKENQ